MRRIAACLSIVCAASVASAQHGEELLPYVPSSLDYPDRAAALRPAGMVELSLAWSHGSAWRPAEWEEVLFFHSIDVRVPYGSLIVEASWTGALAHHDAVDGGPFMGTGLAHRSGNPRLGASWREQADGWRVELGGALNLAWLHTEVIAPIEVYLEPGRPVSVAPETSPSHYRGDWNWFLLREGQFAFLAHGRVEIDLAPEVVVGAELDLPLVLNVRYEHFAFAPQIALEGAWRFLAHSMLGMRAQLVVLPLFLDSYGVATSIEPFLRIGYAHGWTGWYVLLSAQIHLGRDWTYGPVDPRGSIVPELGGGVLF